MRVVAYVCLVAGCVALAGCGTFGKRQQKPKEPASPSADAGWPAPSEGAAAAASERPPAGLGGLLAGRVLDSFDRPPPATYIKVLPAQDTRDSKRAPLEVATDNQGYFHHPGAASGSALPTDRSDAGQRSEIGRHNLGDAAQSAHPDFYQSGLRDPQYAPAACTAGRSRRQARFVGHAKACDRGHAQQRRRRSQP